MPAASAYTEYTFLLPSGVTHFTLVLRPGGSNGSASPASLFRYTASSPNETNNAAGLPAIYNTLPLQSNRTFLIKSGGQRIYFQVDQGSQILEVDYLGDS